MSLPPSLDHAGSSVDPAFPKTHAQALAFSDLEKQKCLLNLVVSDCEPLEKRASKIISCGTHVMVMRHSETGDHKLGSNWCEHRTCPRCTITQKVKLQKRVEAWIGNVKKYEWRMITFTLRHTDWPLADQLLFLRACFRKIRQTKLWKATQQFGRGFIEIEWNSETKRWHPHLHVLARGSRIDQKVLAKLWSKASTGSFMVWIDLIKQGPKAAHYVAKYVGTAPHLYDEPNAFALLREYYLAIRQKNMIIGYGNPGPMPEPEKQEDGPEAEGEWHPIGSVEEFVTRAAAGDEYAVTVLNQLKIQVKSRNRAPPKEKKKRHHPAPL